MDTLIDIYPQLATYSNSLVALTVLCLAIIVQSVIAGAIGLGKSDEVPGVPLKGNHGDLSFRLLRTYQNSVENLSLFGLTLFLAILASASPTWVNWLAVSHVLIRLIYWAVYYSGVGKAGGGVRTIVFVAGLFANLLLGIVALVSFA